MAHATIKGTIAAITKETLEASKVASNGGVRTHNDLRA
jgi:hypothetical protein